VRRSAIALVACLGWLACQEAFKVYWRRVSRQRKAIVASPTHQVKDTTKFVLNSASHVTLSKQSVLRLVKSMSDQDLREIMRPGAFDTSLHFVDGTWRTVQYLLVVDCLNFCFWPCVPPPCTICSLR
jgi:hypothetical protein